MRQIFTTMTALLALLATATGVRAETVDNYSYDFNTSINTSDHAFRVATGWGHIVDAFTYENPYSGTQTKYQSYGYESTGGVTGGWLHVYGEEIGYTYGDIYHTSTDMIVTPKITGTASIYIKGQSTYYAPVAKFYKVTKQGNTYVAGEELTVDMSNVNTSTWTKVELPAMEGEYIGIHGSYIGLDDFAVNGTAELDLQKAMTVGNVKIADAAPVCNEENKFDVTITATVTNTGDMKLLSTDEGMTLSVIDADNAELKNVPVGKDLDKGATADVQISLTGLDYSATGKGFTLTVKENVTGTTATTGKISPVAYAPEMVLQNKYATAIKNGTVEDFGRINEAKTQSYKIENKGTAPLVITKVDVPRGFTTTLTPQTVAAKQTVDFDITLGTEVFGECGGSFMVTADDVDPVSMELRGLVLDPEKYLVDFEDFEYGKPIPGGIQIEGSDFKVESWDSSNGNKYVIRNSSSYSLDQFFTPLLEVAEGESLTFDVSARYSYSSKLQILYSADRTNWTEAKDFAYDDISTSGYYDLRNVSVSGIPAGKWFIAFKGKDIAVDNIYGFKRIVKDHDLAISAAAAPDKAMVNNEATFKVSLKNCQDKVEAADSYKSVLYVVETTDDGATYEKKDSVAGTAVEIGKSATVENTFVYTPHADGKLMAYAEFVFGKDTLKTDVMEVTVAKEKVSRSATLGDAKTTNSFAPLNLGGGYLSESEVVYTAERIKNLNAGDKVTGITLRGTKGSSDLTTRLRIYIENTEDETVDTQTKTLAGDTTKMQKVYDADYTFKKVGYTTTELLSVDFDTPFEYTGKNIRLRFCSEAESKTSTAYTSFEVDNTDQTHCLVRSVSYSYDSDISNYTEDEITAARYLPAATLQIYVEPATLYGTIADGEIGIGGVDVKLTSDNVEYYATTDKDGKFAVDIIQNERVYTPDFKVAGYIAPALETIDMTAGTTTVAYSVIKKEVMLKAGEWTTVVLPDVAKYPDGEYWQLKEYDEIENKVYFSEISDRKNLKENTPYVFKPAADVTLTNEDFTTDVEAGTAVAEPVRLVGTYSGKRLATTDDTVCMVVSSDKTFNAVGEAGDAMFATKAALFVPADKAETLEIVFGERIVDGISGVSSDNADSAGKVYTLDGRLVETGGNVKNLKSGVYIMGKKKVIQP